MRALLRMLVATTVIGAVGCSEPEADDEQLRPTETRHLPPLPPLRFEPATEEQMTLSTAAATALESGDLETAATALISLQRTESPSQERAEGMIALARIYLERGEFERVADTLDVLDGTAPPMAESALLRGRLFLAIDRPAEAEASLERATRIDLEGIRALAVLSAVQRSVERVDDAEETELAMERRILSHALALRELPNAARCIELLDALDAGFANADAARAAVTALDHEDPEVQAHAIDVVSRIGTAAVAPALAQYAERGGHHAERARDLGRLLVGATSE